jgi:hypothetical protein
LSVDQGDTGADDPVPRIGRGRRRRASGIPVGEITRILMLLVALIAVLGMRTACADGAASWFNVVAPPPSAADAGG